MDQLSARRKKQTNAFGPHITPPSTPLIMDLNTNLKRCPKVKTHENQHQSKLHYAKCNVVKTK